MQWKIHGRGDTVYSLIFTDYQSIPVTITLIRNFPEKSQGDIHYIIVDNSNRRDGVKYLKDRGITFSADKFEEKNIFLFTFEDKEVVLIDAEENGGYARGNNLGARLSSKLFNDDFYLFLNNDLEFIGNIELDKLAELVKKNSQIGIIGPDIISPDGGRQNPRLEKGFWTQTVLWDFNCLWFHCTFNRWLWNLDSCAIEGETGWVSGSFMFVNKYAFTKVSGFDENTFLYCEEMILSEKMRKAGFITFYYPNMTIVHRHKGTQTKVLRRIGHRSKLYYYYKYKKIPKIMCYISAGCYELCELGYHMWHDGIKKWIRK